MGYLDRRDADGLSEFCLRSVARCLTGVPEVDVHRGFDPIIADREGQEFKAIGVATKDDLVVGLAESAVLHTDVVLIGEEVGHAVVYRRFAEHRAGGDRALRTGIGPVFGA